eukprot:TRINITY_DN2527_c0_g1_i7.p1 TRINITY_DN2527_c0_g1~~TRINITY_DN2527_c0_g1_i7.p1  ORF type:complete len:125 (-),score=0.56 TRINITY_DN2527_c0_g1_i7:604-978(-)
MNSSRMPFDCLGAVLGVHRVLPLLKVGRCRESGVEVDTGEEYFSCAGISVRGSFRGCNRTVLAVQMKEVASGPEFQPTLPYFHPSFSYRKGGAEWEILENGDVSRLHQRRKCAASSRGSQCSGA